MTMQDIRRGHKIVVITFREMKAYRAQQRPLSSTQDFDHARDQKQMAPVVNKVHPSLTSCMPSFQLQKN